MYVPEDLCGGLEADEGGSGPRLALDGEPAHRDQLTVGADIPGGVQYK